jgi:hypothetical protein
MGQTPRRMHQPRWETSRPGRTRNPPAGGMKPDLNKKDGHRPV